MTTPWLVAKQLKLHLYPPSVILLGTKCVDVFLEMIFGISPSTSRSYLPFGLGAGKWSWCSIEYATPSMEQDLQALETYPEFSSRVCGGDDDDSSGSGSGTSTMQCMYKFAFETNTTELADVARLRTFLLVLVIAFGIHIVKNKLCRPYFSSRGKTFARQRLGDDWVNDNEEKIFKFGEYCFRLLFHTSLSIYGVYYFYDKPWWDIYNKSGHGGTIHLWTNYGREPIQVGMIWYYLIQVAYNAEAMMYLCRHSLKVRFFEIKKYFPKPWCLVSIQWSDTVRGDFTEMFVHHVATNALLVLSSQMMFHRIGSMILVLHDISDIPVDMSKLANFMKSTTTTAVCLVILILTWFLTRLVILPGAAWYSTIYEAHEVVVSRHKQGSIYTETQLNMGFKTYHGVFVVLIGALIVLHVYWIYLIIKIAYVAITKKKIHDFTEHKKGESEKMFSNKQKSA